MDKRDQMILDHIGRYTITLKRIVDEFYFDGANSQKTLNGLLSQELIQSVEKSLSGNFRYYQLSRKGAKSRGLPLNRAVPKESKGLSQDLAALWFSCMGDVRRKRLSTQELKTLFGAPKGGNVIHVAQHDSEDTTVFRLFIPSDNSSLRAFLPTLKKCAHDAVSDERLLRWIERGTYRFAVLLHNNNRMEDLARLIRNEEFPEILIHLDMAPSPSNLKEFMTPEKEAL